MVGKAHPTRCDRFSTNKKVFSSLVFVLEISALFVTL
jgi:hypothetical protein